MESHRRCVHILHTVRMKGWLSKPSADGRCSGSFCMHCRTKSRSSSLHAPGAGSGTGSSTTCAAHIEAPAMATGGLTRP